MALYHRKFKTFDIGTLRFKDIRNVTDRRARGLTHKVAEVSFDALMSKLTADTDRRRFCRAPHEKDTRRLQKGYRQFVVSNPGTTFEEYVRDHFVPVLQDYEYDKAELHIRFEVARIARDRRVLGSLVLFNMRQIGPPSRRTYSAIFAPFFREPDDPDLMRITRRNTRIHRHLLTQPIEAAGTPTHEIHLGAYRCSIDEPAYRWYVTDPHIEWLMNALSDIASFETVNVIVNPDTGERREAIRRITRLTMP
jgi:hypothetical protein